MKQLSDYLGIRPCTLVYLLLIFFSLTTFLVGQMGFSGLGMSLLVLSLALIKGQLVGSYFMGLGSVCGLWRWPV
ncbi:MAG: cytochrome C oxidase subunit IV family protein [Candidatus Thiodiazotropha sp. (ex. Lucinisca nassula)]|nr:cytochrome C oxidase subunit IV family protein [Candidatus Thiodiazotropha sp. (ex. Lucinisca nassula)]